MATMTETRKLSPQRIAEALGDEPLVGTTVGARILGIKPQNFKRDAAPYLTAIPVEGSAAVYFRSEVEQLAVDRSDPVAMARRRANGHAAEPV